MQSSCLSCVPISQVVLGMRKPCGNVYHLLLLRAHTYLAFVSRNRYQQWAGLEAISIAWMAGALSRDIRVERCLRGVSCRHTVLTGKSRQCRQSKHQLHASQGRCKASNLGGLNSSSFEMQREAIESVALRIDQSEVAICMQPVAMTK